ncbi:hypothetical protein PY257_08475 [Ramlibacter sp. H39-3-26]|uniref:hypothetical protein n=1 Tax=Curvibacter soli TaxID=3031331 RepID=UPI0023DC3BD0|nr:hypothetical protein [Ramlibacter sp. H39-3-26]MDF1485215.1 hypothetical protein [Ramlibacter sp. H39-3-26]
MAVSVRMGPLMEKGLGLAAKRQGIAKSQFIIGAVERALGRKDPAVLYQGVMHEALPPYKSALRKSLREACGGQQNEYAAYLAQCEAVKGKTV